MIMLLTVAAMMVVMAAPAMAQGSGGVVRIDPFNDRINVLPPNPIREPIFVAFPTDPISSAFVEHNPNVVRGECGFDVCPTP
jgi:hypothetical protein